MPPYSLKTVREEYDRLDKICGIDSSQVELRVSTRATNRFGFCHYKRCDDRIVPDYVSITDFIFETENQFWDTIRHEYAHLLVTMRDGKKHGHDATWKAACLEVGCRPERLAQYDIEASKKAGEKWSEKLKYQVICPSCNRSFFYQRAGGVVKALRKGRRCTCPCGSHKLMLINLDE